MGAKKLTDEVPASQVAPDTTVLFSEDVTVLSEKDWNRFVESMESDEKPAEALAQAVERFKRKYG